MELEQTFNELELNHKILSITLLLGKMLKEIKKGNDSCGLTLSRYIKSPEPNPDDDNDLCKCASAKKE